MGDARQPGGLGLEPADIDLIVLSHLRLDHIGWLVDPCNPGQPAFPYARYVVGEAELEYWINETDPAEPIKGIRGGPSDDELAMIGGATQTIDARTEILPVIVVVPTPGHTWGHVSVLVSGSFARALIIGDALHCRRAPASWDDLPRPGARASLETIYTIYPRPRPTSPAATSPGGSSVI